MQPTYDLERFVSEQDAVYANVLAELRHGQKRTHWMWYIFPQLVGLGRTPNAMKFGISGLDEAIGYLGHPVLGPRLLECAALVLGTVASSAVQILGNTDAMKLRSSATLFAEVSPAGSVFHQILTRYFGGVPDDLTLRLLQGGQRGR
ncbi:MAG: DUF1810 domain-containing protein [Gemmatimonadota bacterium]|nr:DUF1810 domain-containing protein [Gemmatimonadota bacterium]